MTFLNLPFVFLIALLPTNSFILVPRCRCSSPSVQRLPFTLSSTPADASADVADDEPPPKKRGRPKKGETAAKKKKEEEEVPWDDLSPEVRAVKSRLSKENIS